MAKKKRLNSKQLAVINDIFSNQFDEQSILEKHKISRSVYNKWLADESFADELSRRMAWAHRQGELIIARYASLAAAKLVELTESEKAETARRACLDIITLPMLSAKRIKQLTDPGDPDAEQVEQLSAQTCSRLLAALAQAEQK